MGETCHRALVAITHWQCSECDAATPYIHIETDDGCPLISYCPNCGRRIEWDYWDNHPFPDEDEIDLIARQIGNEIRAGDVPTPLADSGTLLPPWTCVDIARVARVEDQAKEMLRSGLSREAVTKKLRVQEERFRKKEIESLIAEGYLTTE